MTNQNKYDANFTAGGILFNDFESIKEIIIEDDFESNIQEEVSQNNLLGIPTESARKRVVSEIVRRYNVVGEEFWIWYFDLSPDEKKLALFYVCLKTYPIVLDLHLEVGLAKFKTGSELDAFSVKMRLDELSVTFDEVGSWSESTLDKINSQYRKSLKECGLMKGELLKSPKGISDSFWNYFEGIGDSWVKEMCFK